MKKTLRLWAGVLAFGLAGAPVTLPLPPEARDAFAQLRRECPECVESSVMPCGTPEIGEGARFASTLHQGQPSRGYWLAGEYLDVFDRAYRDASVSDAELEARLRAALESSRLVVAEPGFASLRSLGPPAEVDPRVSGTHRRCLSDPAAHDCSGAECCNKKHGSTEIRATWNDPEGERSLVWLHHPAAAQTLLRRGRALAYFCLAWEPGRLVGPR